MYTQDGGVIRGTIRGPSWARMPTVTLGQLGIAVLWSIEFSYASPYLMSLGLSKSWISMVLLAAPLSGLVVQPIIGALADRSTSRFGRRRPYMVGGVLVCAIGMLLFGHSRRVASWFTALGSPVNNALTIWIAVSSIYLIDFAANTVMASDRAILVDVLPPSKQALANAWAARMSSVGGMLGYFIGNIKLTPVFPFLGTTEIEVLTVLGALLLIVTRAFPILGVSEVAHVPRSTSKGKIGLVQKLRKARYDLLSLPNVIGQIFAIQFFAWLAWFPVSFYTPVYMSDLYLATNGSNSAEDRAEGTRLGARARFIMAVIALVCNWLLPAAISSSSNPATPLQGSKFPKIRLEMLWCISLGVFALSMFAAMFVRSILGAMVLIAVLGLPSALASWAPYSLLNEAILSYTVCGDVYRPESPRRSSQLGEDRPLLGGEDEDTIDGEQEPGTPGPIPLGERAGAILGIHYIFIVIPQFVFAGLSSIIFAIFDPVESTSDFSPAAVGVQKSGPNSVVIIFVLGGVFAGIATVLCGRLARQLRK